MLRGYRHIVLAIGLIAISSAVLGQTDEQSQEPQRKTQQEQGPTQIEPIPLPIEIVEDESESDARKRHEAEARQREIEDLTAQQGMNEATQAMNRATERMAGYSWWSTIFIAIGTGLVFASLILMWGANRAAVAAIKVTRKMGQRQIRAYVAIESVDWNGCEIESTKELVGYTFIIIWKNCGVTPARRCHGRANLAVFDGVMPKDFGYPDGGASSITETNHIGPNQTIRFNIGGFSISDANAVENGKKHVYVWSWFEYDDVFGGKRRRTEVCYDLRIGRDKDGHTCLPVIVGPFNGADKDCHHQTKS